MLRISTSKIFTLAGILVAALLAASPAEAGERTLKIRIKGSVLPGTPSSVTVEELEKLPLAEFSTFDPFLKEQLRFRGVLLEDLAASYGGEGTVRIRLGAVDGYQIEFSSEEWEKKNLLLATRMNGEKIDRKQSGPARIVMPYDEENASERDRLYTPKWIWMINKIEFLRK